jgi:hypothetical protein
MEDLRKFKMVCEGSEHLKKLFENLAVAALKFQQKKLEMKLKEITKTIAEEVSNDLELQELKNKYDSEKNILEDACKGMGVNFPTFNNNDLCRLYQ